MSGKNNWLKRRLLQVSGGAGAAGGVALAPWVVTVAGGSASASGLTGGLAALGGGAMVGGVATVAALPIAVGLACFGAGYIVKRTAGW